LDSSPLAGSGSLSKNFFSWQRGYAATWEEYAKSPENTLVVSPDNRSRTEVNQAIHTELQAKGVVGKEEYQTKVLVPRQDLTERIVCGPRDTTRAMIWAP
jgi:hypothetical protein